MSNQPFNPDKIIDYSKDYYTILGLERGCLPEGKARSERTQVAKILETAYRRSARKSHPDFGGSKEAFIDVVRAKWILEDPLMRKIYESGGKDRVRWVEDGNPFEVDWSKIGTYRQGTSADTIGFGIFLSVCNRVKELDLVPAFYPTDETHNYEWDWVIKPQEQYKLALALVHDESEVLRLTSGESTDTALPFKIYICIPRRNVHFLRENSQKVTLENGADIEINGQLRAAWCSDYNLLETTSLEEAMQYISRGGKLEKDLTSFRDGTMIQNQQLKDMAAAQPIFTTGDRMKDIDTNMLRNIIAMRSFTTVEDEHAADFLENLPDK